MKKKNPHMTDLDLPLAYRTQANLWKMHYFEAYKELVKANKGLRRLRRKINRLKRGGDLMTPYRLAERFIGTKEVPGSGDNAQVLAMLKLDADWPEHDEVPWCSAFVNYVCWLLRLPRSKSLMARSWLDVGIPVGRYSEMIGFDIVVLSRGNNPNHGHVGFFASAIGDQIYILGGNQSNTVSVQGYNLNRVVGIRRLYHEQHCNM